MPPSAVVARRRAQPGARARRVGQHRARRGSRPPRSRRSPRRRRSAPRGTRPASARSSIVGESSSGAFTNVFRCTEPKRRNSASSRPGIIRKTRSCSAYFIRVWKPTRLYAVAAASSGRSCTTAYGRRPGARIGQADRLHRAEGERLLAALGHHLAGQAALEVARLLELARGHLLRLDERPDERLVAGLVEGAVDVRLVAAAASSSEPPSAVSAASPSASARRPCRSATASRPCSQSIESALTMGAMAS